MKIGNIKVEEKSSLVKISADIGGVNLWFKIPREHYKFVSADPFVCAAFFPAMLSGESVDVPDEFPISEKLVDGIYSLQKIFSCWNKKLSKFDINGIVRPIENATDGTATFFSGGVDSLYTLKTQKRELDYTVYINGFDFDMEQSVFDRKYDQNKRLSEYYGKKIIPVQTNFNSMMFHDYKISRALHHGSCMASIAHILGLQKAFIPSSYTHNHTTPFGSHPLTDHLWSNEVLDIVHSDASVARSAKTMEIIKDEFVSDNIVVCWREPDKNCGKCGKCLRTMIVLEVAGIASKAFPVPLNDSSIAKLGCENFSDLSFFQDNLDLAIAYSHEMALPLKKAIRKNALKLYLKEYDSQYLEGTVKKIFKTIFRKVDYNDGLMRPKP